MIRQAGEITAGLTDQLEKIDRIYASVQQRCHYLGLYEGAGGLIPVPAAEVFELGFGDCKGLATLLISLLRVAGIAAHPVLVCTPAAGQLAPDIPNLAQFNHFIAWADTGGGGIFLDGTVDFCPAGFVPAVDAASPVLLLRPGAIGLVEIPGAAWDAGDDQQVVEGRLEADGLLHLSLARSMSGNLGLRWRNGLASLDRRRKREVVREALLPGGLAVRGEEPEVLGMDEWRRPLTMQMTATSSRPLPADDHAIYLPRNLIPEKWAFDSDVDCDGQLDLRRRPRRFCTWSIELPAGFVLAAPDSTSLAKDGLQLALRIWQEGRLLKLERVFRFTQDFAEAEQVAAMRQALADAARGEAGHIELRRPAHD